MPLQIAERADTMKEQDMDGAQGIAIIAIVCGTVLDRISDAGFLQDGHIAHLLVMIQYAVDTCGYPCLFFLFGIKAVELALLGVVCGHRLVSPRFHGCPGPGDTGAMLGHQLRQ